MRKIAIAAAAAALVFGAGLYAWNAEAMTAGASSLAAGAKNYSPIVKQTACRRAGPFCPPGFTWRCKSIPPFKCKCRPC